MGLALNAQGVEQSKANLWALSLTGALLVVIPGCRLAPSVNILGSFFPAWLISIIAGVVLTVLVRQVFIATKIAPYLRPAGLMYPCLALLLIFAAWLVLFGN